MGNIKLFRMIRENINELIRQSVSLEKSLQQLLERHLETFPGIRFLVSEHSTGKKHSGRIDTLKLFILLN